MNEYEQIQKSLREKPAMQRIQEDLALRGVELAGVIGVDQDKNLVIITYDSLGLVSNISQGDKVIALYGKASIDTGAMREIFTLEAAKK